MTVFARRLETIQVWASQNVNGPAKFRTLARCANSHGPIKYCINRRFLLIYDENLNRYWGNIVPIPACLLGHVTTVCENNVSYRIHGPDIMLHIESFSTNSLHYINRVSQQGRKIQILNKTVSFRIFRNLI